MAFFAPWHSEFAFKCLAQEFITVVAASNTVPVIAVVNVLPICTMIIAWINGNIVTSRLKSGIVEPEDTSIARQRLGKGDSATTDTQATLEELLGTVFSVWPAQNGFKEEFI